jgi:hypothetical protein
MTPGLCLVLNLVFNTGHVLQIQHNDQAMMQASQILEQP